MLRIKNLTKIVASKSGTSVKGKWQYLGQLNPARLSVLKKVATIESSRHNVIAPP